MTGEHVASASHLRAALWLVVAAGCWGLDTTLSAYALRELRPADLFVTETTVGAVVVWVYVCASSSYRRPARLRPHLVLGLIEPGFAYPLFDVGLSRTSADFLVARRLPSTDDTLSGTAFQLLAASGVALAFGLSSWRTGGSRLPVASAGHIGVGLAAGVVGIAIPFFLLNRALERVQASTAALILNLVPVFAVATAATLLMEPLMAGSLAGGALILVGLTVLGRAAEPEAAMTAEP